MVSSESEVLPATFAVPTESPAGEQQDGETDVFTQFDVDSLLQARASRPSCDDGWLDTDHYFDQDLPVDSFKDGEWKEKYTDLDKIQVKAQFEGSGRRGCWKSIRSCQGALKC